MKNSNRILCFGIAALFLGVIIVFLTLSSLNSLFSPTRDLAISVKNESQNSRLQTIKGSGKIVGSTQTLPGFDKIKATGNYKIILQPGTKLQVNITTDDNIQKHLRVRVDNGELQLQGDPTVNLSPTQPIEAKITTPELNAIQLVGDTELTALDLNTPALMLNSSGYSHTTLRGRITVGTFNLSGGSNLDVNITNNQTLKINSHGGGTIKLAGSTDNLILNNGGSFDIKASNLNAKNATINGAGNTQIHIHATDKITVNTVGKSTLHYSGHPKVITHSFGNIRIIKEDE